MTLMDALLPTHAALTNQLHKPDRRSQTAATYQLRKSVLEAIWFERLRQKQLFREGKIEFACESPVVDPMRKLAVLGEEFGEVAKEVLEAKKHTRRVARERLKAELTQVAAVSIAWLEALEDEQ